MWRRLSPRLRFDPSLPPQDADHPLIAAQHGVAQLLSALQRKESRGLHYNLDYPHSSEVLEDTILQKQPDGALRIESVPIPQAQG